VDACADANGARSNTNPEDTIAEPTAGGGSAGSARIADAQANTAMPASGLSDQLETARWRPSRPGRARSRRLSG